MRKILISGLCLTALAAIPGYAAGKSQTCMHAIPTGPKIKVLLERGANSALLEAKGAYRVLRKDTNIQLSAGRGGKRFVVHPIQDGLKWGEEYPDVYQISVVPASNATTFLVNGIQYKGSISVYHTKDGKIALVNELPIEEYLKSTLAVDPEGALSKEAMAAKVIVARTEACHKMAQAKAQGRPWDVTAQEAKYFGYGVTYPLHHIEEAVDWTRFMVLESKKQSEKLEKFSFDVEKAEDLAAQGCDAKKILSMTFPQAKLGVTIHPDEIALK